MEQTNIAIKKPIYKKWYFWVLALVFLAIIGAISGGSKKEGGSISKTSYDKISVGMSKVEVEKILGEKGEQNSESNVAGTTGEMVSYGTSIASNIVVVYIDGKVQSKAQSGLD